MTYAYTPESFIVGHFPVVTGDGTLILGENCLRGTVLGQIKLSGKLKKVNSANTDGSETPYGVLMHDADASAGDVGCSVVLSGEIDQAALIFGGNDNVETHRKALRILNIYPKLVRK